MIVDALFELVGLLAGGILGLLPTTPAAPNLVGAWNSWWESVEFWLAGLADVFPLDVLSECIGILFVWFGVIYTVKLVAWLLALVHIGGSDA